MADDPDADATTNPDPEPLPETVAAVLDDVDAAYADYDRGYADADATLSVVMSHLDRLRDGTE